MKSRALIAALGLLAAAPILAADAPPTLNVWPGVPPGDKPDMPGAEQLNPQSMLLTGAVNTPTLTVFRPDKDKDTGAAILVCPGGGFYQLSMRDEGTAVGSWLASIGVTGVVLKYRIPNREGMPRYMAALQDAQRSMSIIRSKVAEWHLDPKRIGILGFSAGGQVAADVETNFDKRMYDPVDDIDKNETRPDFAVLIYPGGIFARNANPQGLTADVRVSKDTPPTFLDQSNDDRDGSENVVYMYLALKKAGVPAELHVFGEGGHGYGIRTNTAPHATWPARLQDWMNFRGYLKPYKPVTEGAAPPMVPATQTAQNDPGAASRLLVEGLKEMETIKVGSTRADLLNVFTPNGGLSTATSGSFLYRKSDFIQVDVEFAVVCDSDGRALEHPEDKIIKISKPTIALPTAD